MSSENNVYIAEDGNGEAVGFMWAQLNSIYAEQPYISLLGVRSDYRAHGVGQKLIQYFIDIYESKGFERGLIAVNDLTIAFFCFILIYIAAAATKGGSTMEKSNQKS